VKRVFFYILVVTQLFACASVDPVAKKEGAAIGSVDTQRVLAVKNWQLLGRLSIRSEKESWIAILNWQHDESLDNLVLSTSVGGVIAKLKYSSSAVFLSDAKGVEREISDQELQGLLGYAPPLSHLKFWARGVGNPQLALQLKEVSKADSRVFEQDGWLVTLSKFRQEGELRLPKKVFIQKDGVKIKLVVDKWLV